MFRYVKGEGKEKWKLIENSEKALQAAIAAGAKYTTILSVDQDLDLLDPEAKVNYKGPLYFDIDSTDENESLADVRKLLLTLYKSYGVDINCLAIHCTGGKGFHVLVPSKVFSTGKANPFLPQIYKTMALEFNLEHLDLGIYSGGKGRMFRLENVQRENLRYKVKLSAAQVFSLTMDQIKALTLMPGEATPFELNIKDLDYSAELAALFKKSEFKPQKITPVEDAKLQALQGDPGCIKKLLSCKDIFDGVRFNYVTMTLAMYANGRGWSLDTLTAEANNFITTYPSSVYKSLKEKYAHLKAIYSYVASTPAYKFNCSAVRKVVDCEDDCCPTCPIMGAMVAEYYDPRLGIEVANNCYFKKSDAGRTQITTFVIKPLSIVEFLDDQGRTDFTIYANLHADNDHKQAVVFTQPDWASKSALIKRLPHPAFAYIGGDSDVQKIFKVISQIEVPKKIGVRIIGLHKVNDEWHFVSDKGSITASGKKDELLLESDYYLPTSLATQPDITTAELHNIMQYLFKFNSIDIAVPLIGWFVAAMYKERIFAFTHQFPLLFIFGAAGAGKTQTLLNLKRLFAVETDNIKSIADVTPFTLIKAANSNNTIPLLLDEYKATTFNPYQIKMVSKLIRAAYNNEAGERGTASQEIRTYHYRSPIILAGEQTVTEPAARDRILEVHMNKTSSAPHLKEFMLLQDTKLPKLGKKLLLDALSIEEIELKTMYHEAFNDVDPEYMDRPRVNQTIMLLGLRLLKRVVEPMGFGHIIDEAWKEYSEQDRETNKETFIDNRKSDIDRIMEGIAIMKETDERYSVAQDWEYIIQNNQIHMNLRVVYTKYMKFAQEYKLDMEPMNFMSFMKLIKKEPYFVRDNAVTKLKQGIKMCMILDICALKAKGVQIQSLLEEKLSSDDATELNIND